MTETFDLTLDQARAYESVLVPALFAQWVEPLLAHAGVAEGQQVLDVACGTGVVSRAAAAVVGRSGHVVGVDLNPAMIEVARQACPRDVELQVGDAAHLPHDDGTFDAVVCQSALFFFPDPVAALSEMARVVVPGGAVALQTYAAIDEQPGYGPFVDAVCRHAGSRARNLLGTYWSRGDAEELGALLATAGLRAAGSRDLLGTVAFPSLGAMVRSEITATPLARDLDEEACEALAAELEPALRAYLEPDGRLRLPIRALFVRGDAPAP
jgi:ubiquinone/menaquinone biosynthesis C-methylase UbiE